VVSQKRSEVEDGTDEAKLLDDTLVALDSAYASFDNPDANPQFASMQRGLYVAGIGAVLADVEIDGADYGGIGVGAALGHGAIDNAIAKAGNIFQQFTLNPGLFYSTGQEGQLGYGISASINGGQRLGKSTKAFYSLGA
jgi:hypothetical protein